jgi:hypothetical protein
MFQINEIKDHVKETQAVVGVVDVVGGIIWMFMTLGSIASYISIKKNHGKLYQFLMPFVLIAVIMFIYILAATIVLDKITSFPLFLAGQWVLSLGLLFINLWCSYFVYIDKFPDSKLKKLFVKPN